MDDFTGVISKFYEVKEVSLATSGSPFLKMFALDELK